MPELDITPRNVITNENGKLRSVTGPEGMQAFRMRTIITGLKFEMNCPGMKLTRGPSCLAHAKQLTGLKTNDRAKQLARMEMLLEQQLAKCIIEEAGETPSED